MIPIIPPNKNNDSIPFASVSVKKKPAILYHNVADRQRGFATKIKLFFYAIQLVHNLLDFSNQSAVDTV